MDTSQSGGFSNFRNDTVTVHGHHTIPFHSATHPKRRLGVGAGFNELPDHGVVEFDYISTAKDQARSSI